MHGKWKNAFASGPLSPSDEREKNLQYHSLIPHSVENIRKPGMISQKLLMQIVSGVCPGMLQHPGVSAGT